MPLYRAPQAMWAANLSVAHKARENSSKRGREGHPENQVSASSPRKVIPFLLVLSAKDPRIYWKMSSLYCRELRGHGLGLCYGDKCLAAAK